MITADLRFTRDSDGHEMLFDLSADPGELQNLAALDRDSPARNVMLETLVDAMMTASDLTRTEPVSR